MTSQRSVAHLGDFTATPRMLVITMLALPVGAAGAGLAWVLLRLIGVITNAVFYQRASATLVAPGYSHHTWALLLLAPIGGGLLVGLMARFGSEKIRGHGMPEAIEAVLTGGSRVQPRVAVLKPVSAAIAIGTGGPFGAEGPIIMTGGAVGSLFAQMLQLTADERKTLLVSGAAAGMAATFNAPLASLLLAVELLLFEWRPRSMVPVTAAVSVATILRGPLLGTGHVFLSTAAFHLHVAVYLFCVVAGVASALLAAVATFLVYTAEDLFGRLHLHWMWWPALGGVVIGVGGIVQPHALGVGYDVIDSELTGKIGLGLVVSLLIVKTLIWSLSLGSGTSGGVLAPMFMIGGALGALEAQVFPHVGAGFWPIVGLAGVLGGVMRAPFTGIVFAIELTGRFDAVLPLMISTGVAYGASVLLLRRSILTEKIARRGYHLTREYDVDPLEALFVDEVVAPGVIALSQATTVTAALALVAADVEAATQRLFPVVDDSGRLVGVISENMLLTAAKGERGSTAVGTLAVREPVRARGNDTLRAAAHVMADAGVTRLVVVDHDDPDRPVGVVSLQQLLQGRVRDLREAHRAERVLRVSMPRRRQVPAPDFEPGTRSAVITPEESHV